MLKKLSFLSVILWMAVIFNFSSKPAVESSKSSSKVTSIAVTTMNKVKPSANMDVKIMEHIVRKCAHFSIYFIFGILVLIYLIISKKSKLKIFYAILICLLYAMSDEFHQLFVTGRSAQLTDVIIDTCGSTFGIIICNNFFISLFSKNRMK